MDSSAMLQLLRGMALHMLLGCALATMWMANQRIPVPWRRPQGETHGASRPM